MAWVNKFSCNNCDYESSTTVLWGGFNYVLKEDDNLINENVEREYGWCYDCEYICPIEIIPTIDSLEIKIEKLKSRYDSDKLELTKKENRLIKFKSTKKRIDYLRRLMKWYPDEIQGKELLITAFRNRNSKPKCLFCASDDVKYLTVPKVDKYKDEPLKNINFQHPNCGGELRIEDIPLSISGISTERYYSLDGCLLDENTSTKDVGIKSWNEDDNTDAAFWNKEGDNFLRGCEENGWTKDFDLAIQYFEQAIELDPGYVMAHYNMGLTYKDKGDYAKAIQSFEKVIDLKPDDYEAYNQMGILYSYQDNDTIAIRNYEKAIELNPGHGQIHVNLGLTYKDKGDYANAIQCIEKAIDLNDDYSFIYYIDLGIVYKDKGDYDKAIQSFDKAIELDPHNDNFTKELIDEEMADMTGK